jgi:hypothetical protein
LGHDPLELVDSFGEDFEGLIECAVVRHGGTENTANRSVAVGHVRHSAVRAAVLGGATG